MITAPNKYLGITANKLSCIATELEQKNATLTAENVHLQKELEAEHALAEALGHDCERLKDENEKLQELVQDMHAVISYQNSWWDCMCRDTRRFADRLRELGIEVG